MRRKMIVMRMMVTFGLVSWKTELVPNRIMVFLMRMMLLMRMLRV